MFYLNFFLKNFTRRPWAGLTWLASSVTILVLSFVGPTINDYIDGEEVAQNKEVNPYFYAIMPKKINSGYVKRKLLELPGVEKVLVLSEEKVSSQIKSILAASSLELDDALVDLNYAGVKISLSPDLKVSSQELIRNYLGRLTGKNQVTMGAIKKPEVKKDEVSSSFFSQNRFLVITFMASLAYFIALGLIYRPLKEDSFVLEQYQRKNQIYLKTLSYTQAPLLVGVILSAVVYKIIMIPLVAGVVFSMAFYLILGEKKKIC